MPEGYSTIEDAAAAALHAIKGRDKEHVGIIYQDPKTGKFRFTDPLTQGSRKKAGGSHKVPKGSARAIYHNHPMLEKEDDLQDKFSQGDIDLAGRTGLTSFISAGDSIMRWDPKSPGKLVSKGGRGSSLREQVGVGSPVLAQIPMDQMRQRRESRVLITKADQEGMRNFGLDPKNAQHAKEWMANKK